MALHIRFLASLLSATALMLLLAASCAQRDNGDQALGGGCATCSDDASLDRTGIDVPLPEGGDSAPPDAGVSRLCGSGCMPDLSSACENYSPPAAEPGDAGDAGMATETGGEQEPTDAGPPPADGDAPRTRYACRIVQTGTAECAPAGSGMSDAPCLSSADCAPGLACVGEGYGGLCRPYCCGGNDACEPGLFCTERPLVSAESGSVNQPIGVPVCVIPDRCDLKQRFPCSEELAAKGECTCREGLACMLVNDGATSCVKPGKGMAGDDCPCAWDHVCSQGTRQCLKLCSTKSLDTGCGAGRCMATSGVPEGFGVCVGLQSSDAG
jgi:hypothetical protein